MHFEFDDEVMLACQEAFNNSDPEERLYKTHYELAKETGIDSQSWKVFLTDTRVSNFIDQEVTLIKSTTLRKMIKNADSNDKSYGAAQMLNALNKTMDTDVVKDGPTFIYMAVPLNERELGAPNVQHVRQGLFDEEEPYGM